MAKNHDLQFIEICSQEYPKVYTAFFQVASNILNKIEDGVISIPQTTGIKTGDHSRLLLTSSKMEEPDSTCC
jgi:hypothetical protein